MALLLMLFVFFCKFDTLQQAVLEISIDILPDMNNNDITHTLSTKYIYKPVRYSST